MHAFACAQCGQLLFFENSHCLRCGASLAFIPDRLELCAVSRHADGLTWSVIGEPDGPRFRSCARSESAACNWLIAESEVHGSCASCRLTQGEPPSEESELRAFALAEGAKRRLLYQLLDLSLPVVGRDRDPEVGLAFVLAGGKTGSPVVTGHRYGVITLDLSESDSVHRERMKSQFGEPYRTVLGHFRHEIGHYYWMLLIEGRPAHKRFRRLFGDERASYAEALEQNYTAPARPDWTARHVSAYAAVHPWEDWAETFAHYLHIRDTLQTSAAFKLHVDGPVAPAIPPLGGKLAARAIDNVDRRDFAKVIVDWLPLVYAFNAVNRCMGKEDLYPFVLRPAVIEKLSFVHEIVRKARRSGAAFERERVKATAA
jgi:hypothetical protein